MKLKRLIILGVLFTTLKLSANDEISYDWFEISYGEKLNGSLSEFTTLAGSFEISDKFYITADASTYRRFSLFDETSIGFRLGFHKDWTDKTDFYSEIGFRNTDIESLDSFDNVDIKIGTRSILSPKFELITHVEYKDIDIEAISDTYRITHSQSGLNFGVKTLYKMNKNSSISLGLAVDNSFVSPSIGYRFNW